MKIFDLPCFDSSKSFYGKAKVIEHDNGEKELLSYNTIVCKITKSGEFEKTWTGSTQTTSRHIKSFREFYGV